MMTKSIKYAMLLLAMGLITPGFAGQAQGITCKAITPSSTSDRLGAFIIILGDISSHHCLSWIKNGGDQVYERLRWLGFPANRIYYTGPSYGSISPYQNAFSTPGNISYAIDTWAANSVSSSDGLGIYLYDHGAPDQFCIDGIAGASADLNASTFNTYLDILQANTGVHRIFIIDDSCFSGSFIKYLSKPDRIICTGADESDYMWFDPDKSWAYFSEGFWGSIVSGNTIGQAYIDACHLVVNNGYYSQLPEIDDNHDGVGHSIYPCNLLNCSGPNGSYTLCGTIPCDGDGSDALTTRFVYGYSVPKASIFTLNFNQTIKPFFVKWVTNGFFWVWAKVQNNTNLSYVSARIITPGWKPSLSSVHHESDGWWAASEDLGNVSLYDLHKDGNWTGLYNPTGVGLQNGTYGICFTAASDDGIQFASVSTACTVNQNGIAPPDTTPPTVSIKTPFDGESVTGVINITADANDDQGLSSLAILVDGTLIKNTTNPTYPYEVTKAYDTQNATHTIKAIATDDAGHSTSVEITVNPKGTVPGYSPAIVVAVIATIAGIASIRPKRWMHSGK